MTEMMVNVCGYDVLVVMMMTINDDGSDDDILKI